MSLPWLDYVYDKGDGDVNYYVIQTADSPYWLEVSCYVVKGFMEWGGL